MRRRPGLSSGLSWGSSLAAARTRWQRPRRRRQQQQERRGWAAEPGRSGASRSAPGHAQGGGGSCSADASVARPVKVSGRRWAGPALAGGERRCLRRRRSRPARGELRDRADPPARGAGQRRRPGRARRRGAGSAASPSRCPRRRLPRRVPEVSRSPARPGAHPEPPRLQGEAAAARRGRCGRPSPVPGGGGAAPLTSGRAASSCALYGAPGPGGRRGVPGWCPGAAAAPPAPGPARPPPPRWLLAVPAGRDPRPLSPEEKPALGGSWGGKWCRGPVSPTATGKEVDALKFGQFPRASSVKTEGFICWRLYRNGCGRVCAGFVLDPSWCQL